MTAAERVEPVGWLTPCTCPWCVPGPAPFEPQFPSAERPIDRTVRAP